ncbi:MAG: PKD domain-containing protein [Candidatus Omnitrophica bacterium]|nr:PKD domain-containing protein [Candidatus Omnitrophota bacterium]MDD5660905.1 PKD domain-containing protein [Candidatus Omnitrophota bacterium]
MFFKKILALLSLAIILSGCATYKFQQSTPAPNGGYLVSYDGKPIIEYTVGKDKSLPDLTLAKERFKRRRPMVEYYYKKMGLIESKFKANFWDPPAMVIDFIGGILRWPFTAVDDYKYNRNPKYKERIDRLEEEREALEKANIASLKEKLQAYIVKDLAKEPQPESLPAGKQVQAVSQPQILPAVPPPAPEKAIPPEVQSGVIKSESSAPLDLVSVPEGQDDSPVMSADKDRVDALPAPPAEQTAVKQPVHSEILAPVVIPAKEVKPAVKPLKAPPVAVIIAKPIKGFSPLKVKFYGQKSYSKSGKIVSYFWDFGDADTSIKKNPENTFWSTTYGLRQFPVTLTVKDNAGGSSSTTTIIEVSTR